MEPIKITRQMIDFQKALFDNTYTVVAAMQDNSENMVNGILNQFTWVTEEAKRPFNESVTFIKRAREDYRKTIDQGFDNLAELIDKKEERTAQEG